VTIGAIVTGETKDEIIHVLAEGHPHPEIGETLTLEIDWERRYRLMKMHTACHLLSVIYPYPITGASVAEDDSRVDFDFSQGDYSKEEATARLNDLIRADHPVFVRWITEADLSANRGLVKSKNVRPPIGLGRIRLVCIGENAIIDSQPCGGTHVASTGEIGEIHIGKIEKKGRENRRFRIRFGPPPEA
jgi:misacylated tRNA(Ala) deacylase